MKDIIYLKGKESITASILLIIGGIVLFVPIVLFVIFKALFKIGNPVKEQGKVPAGMRTEYEDIY